MSSQEPTDNTATGVPDKPKVPSSSSKSSSTGSKSKPPVSSATSALEQVRAPPGTLDILMKDFYNSSKTILEHIFNSPECAPFVLKPGDQHTIQPGAFVNKFVHVLKQFSMIKQSWLDVILNPSPPLHDAVAWAKWPSPFMAEVPNQLDRMAYFPLAYGHLSQSIGWSLHYKMNWKVLFESQSITLREGSPFEYLKLIASMDSSAQNPQILQDLEILMELPASQNLYKFFQQQVEKENLIEGYYHAPIYKTAYTMLVLNMIYTRYPESTEFLNKMVRKTLSDNPHVTFQDFLDYISKEGLTMDAPLQSHHLAVNSVQFNYSKSTLPTVSSQVTKFSNFSSTPSTSVSHVSSNNKSKGGSSSNNNNSSTRPATTMQGHSKLVRVQRTTDGHFEGIHEPPQGYVPMGSHSFCAHCGIPHKSSNHFFKTTEEVTPVSAKYLQHYKSKLLKFKPEAYQEYLDNFFHSPSSSSTSSAEVNYVTVQHTPGALSQVHLPQ